MVAKAMHSALSKIEVCGLGLGLSLFVGGVCRYSSWRRGDFLKETLTRVGLEERRSDSAESGRPGGIRHSSM